MPATGTAATVGVAVAAAGVGIAVASESDPEQNREQEVYHENGHRENGRPENGHGTESHGEVIREIEGVEEPEIAGSRDEEEVVEHDEQGLLQVGDGAVGVVETPQPHAMAPPVEAEQEQEQEQEQEEPRVEEEVTLIHVQDTSTTSSSDTQFVLEEPTDETKHIQEGNGAGDDIEQMVHLLELSIPKARPLSILSIPDEVHEIPDEE